MGAITHCCFRRSINDCAVVGSSRANEAELLPAADPVVIVDMIGRVTKIRWDHLQDSTGSQSPGCLGLSTLSSQDSVENKRRKVIGPQGYVAAGH